MKHFISILCICCFFSLQLKAQFFDFNFSDPFSQRQQVKQEKVTSAQYKGGKDGLNNFLKKEFKFIEGKENISGTIVVAGIINEKGKISENAVAQSLDKELDAEAVRVMKKLKFKPATQGKKKIKSRIDIQFPIRHGKVNFSNLKTIDI